MSRAEQCEDTELIAGLLSFKQRLQLQETFCSTMSTFGFIKQTSIHKLLDPLNLLIVQELSVGKWCYVCKQQQNKIVFSIAMSIILLASMLLARRLFWK